jgi:hypothetical protein
MTNTLKKLKYCAVLSISACLIACGGGGTSTAVVDPTPFVPTPIASTPSTNGVVNGTTGNAANGVKGSYNATALQGELLTVSVDTAALTFQYKIDGTAYNLDISNAHTRYGVLVANGAGCWNMRLRGWVLATNSFTGAVSSNNIGSVCARADGVLVMNYAETVSGVSQAFNALLTPTASNSATPPAATDLLGTYNILMYSNPSSGTKTSHWMEASITQANGVLTVRGCVEARYAATCVGGLGARTYRLDSITGQTDRYTLVNTTTAPSVTIGTLSVSKINGQIILNGDVNNATTKGLWMGVPTTSFYLNNISGAANGAWFTASWRASGALNTTFRIDIPGSDTNHTDEVFDSNNIAYDLDPSYIAPYNCTATSGTSCWVMNGMVELRQEGPQTAYYWKGIVIGQNVMVFIPASTSNPLTTPMILYRQ